MSGAVKEILQNCGSWTKEVLVGGYWMQGNSKELREGSWQTGGKVEDEAEE